MKTIFRIIIFFLFGAVFLQSCTKISEPYYTVKSVSVDTNKRAVLLEDYTGHLCVNCAPAAKIASTIQDLNDGEVFAVAVHAGMFARPNPVSYPPYLAADYRCQAGNDWNDYSPFGIDAYPKGMVNRRLYNGAYSLGTSDWNQAVKVASGLPKVAIMTVHNTYGSQSKMMNSKVEVRFLLSYTGKVNLTVCILEDSIYGGQLNNIPPDSIPIMKNFLFMHMLRGSLNGSFGEQISVNPSSGTMVSNSYTLDFNNVAWVPAHCSVIAFISDADTKEVLHVAKSSNIKP